MPKLNYNGNRLPKMCDDRGRAFAWHNGKRHYFGVSGSPDADENYRRFKIALLASPTDPAPVRRDEDSPISETSSPLDAGTDGDLEHHETQKYIGKKVIPLGKPVRG